MFAVVPIFGAGLIIIVALWLINSGSPGNLDFYLHQNRYKNIVEKAKALAPQAARPIHTNIDGFKVDIERKESNTYTLTITTQDQHHFGVYGYVFSDLPLKPHPADNYPDLSSIDNPGDFP